MSDIAINPVTRRVQFTGNTGTGPYAFTFNILVDGDIAVFKGTTELTLTTDYTVSINANGTGSITLTAALIASDVLTIIGGRELSRTTDFVTAGDLLASSLNEQLDSNVIMTQQLDEKLGRGLFVNPGDVFTDLELPLKDDRKGTVLGFNETTGDPEPGPTLSDVDSLATISADIKTLAEIQDGTVATDAITNVNTIRTDVTTVSGISSNVTTVAGNTSNINTVAGNNANITTVAGINSDVTTVSGISSDVTTVAADGTDIGVVAGISSDVTTVSGVSTEIGRLGTADAVSDMNVLSAPAVIADMDSLADNVSAISIVSDDIGNVIAVAVNAANINTVAADGADIGTVAGDISNVNTVATNITSVNTNATNITDIQNASANAATATTQAGIATTQAGIATTKASEASASEVAAEAAKVAAEAALDEFTDIYLGAKASDPTTDNDGNALTAGDQYFNTTINVLKIYNGSAWQAAAIDSSGFVETTGDTMTGNLSFGDDDKAVFGDASEFQIYHTAGGVSYITETGVGGLFLQGANVILENTSGDNYFLGVDGGASTLYYSGAAKLATTSTGIDVTGTVTADGLTVEGNSGGGGGSTTPIVSTISDTDTGSSWVVGDIFAATDYKSADGSAVGAGVRVRTGIAQEASAGGSSSYIVQTAPTTAGTMVDRLSIASNGDISFYDSQGSSQSFFWDASAESLGIGTDSPSAGAVGGTVVHVQNSGATASVRVDRSDAATAGTLSMTSGNTTVGLYGTGAKPMVFYTDSTERMRIDSSGNVIINVNAGASDAGTIRITGGTSGLSNLQFADTADGNIGMLQYDHTSNYMLFQVNNSEAMRIDSSGNLLVGTTDSLIWNEAATDNSKEGVVIEPRSLQISRYQDTQALFNRQGNYGRHILFASDGAETGSIQSQANALEISTTRNELYLTTNSSTQFSGANVGLGPFLAYDGQLDLGRNNARYRDLYLSGGVVFGDAGGSGTSTSNTLDSYEEGTFTPTALGATTAGTTTYASQVGSYTKVGDMVSVDIYISWSAMTGTGNLENRWFAIHVF